MTVRQAHGFTRRKLNLRRIKYYWRETRRHLQVQPSLYPSLNFIFCLDQRIERLICVDDRFTIISHQADKGCVPLIHNLGEGRRAGAHENLADSVVEPLDTCTQSAHDIERNNCTAPSSETRKKACAILSFVCLLVRFQTASLREYYSPPIVRILGKICTWNPHIKNNSCGFSREYTLTNVSSHSIVVSDHGKFCPTFQNTAGSRLTSCLIRRMWQSRGQQRLLLYPITLLVGSGLALRYRWIRSRASSVVKRKRMWNLST